MQLLWKQIFTHDPNEKIKTKQEIEMLDSIRSPSEELKQDCFLASSGHGGEVLHTFTMPQDTISWHWCLLTYSRSQILNWPSPNEYKNT